MTDEEYFATQQPQSEWPFTGWLVFVVVSIVVIAIISRFIGA